METENTFNQDVPQLSLSENSKGYLKTTAFWTKFISIISFISAGILVLAGIFMSIMGAFINSIMPNNADVPMAVMKTMYISLGFFYIVLAIACVFPALYLYRFSQSASNALFTNDNDTFENAVKNMKSYWKFTGIMTIVILGFCILIIPIIFIISFISAL